MSSYVGLHAELYDRIYADKPYEDEARFVHDLVDAPGGALLDVGCGTGRHARAFAELGYDVTGVDVNPELLAVALRSAGGRVRFVRGDMRDLHVDGGPFDVVTCLFDSIGYAQDNDGVIATLRSLARHVATTGKVVCEFLHAPALMRGFSPTRVARWNLPEERYLIRTAETTLDVERMVMQVRYELLLIDGGGATRRAEEEHTNRCFSVPEMRLLSEAAGLRTNAIIPAYRDGEIDAETFHLLLIASRGS